MMRRPLSERRVPAAHPFCVVHMYSRYSSMRPTSSVGSLRWRMNERTASTFCLCAAQLASAETIRFDIEAMSDE